ncbi:MAG: NADH:ubiquinone reductase (Na(+)-transporting) subunit A, partial [Bacteroidales bacterium]|nr:NADH:ubiquinone reductase (Na(+)-transporting) subunit A [Bacteroidales bacterium]
MPKVIRIKKGLDIKLKGRPEKIIIQAEPSEFYAVKPPDFPGLSPLPKLSVKIGSDVKTGSPLFYDKNKPDILFTSPV